MRAGPGRAPCRSWSRSSATTARSAAKMNALGPLMDTLGATTKGVTFDARHARSTTCARKNGAVRGGVADGRPSLKRDVHVCEAILALSGTTNGHLADAGLQDPREAHRQPTGRPGRGARGQADHLRRHPGRAGAGDHLAGVVGLRDRRPPLLAVHHQRRAAEAVAHADRAAALLPRPRLDDRARRGPAGLPATAEHGARCSPSRADRRRPASSGSDGALPDPAQQVVDPLGVPGQPVHARRSRAAARTSG